MKYKASIDALLSTPTWRVTIIAEDSWGHQHEVATVYTRTRWGAQIKAQRLLRRRRKYMSRLNKAIVLR